jgi:hypothetical protein
MVMAMGIQELFAMGVGGDYEGKKKIQNMKNCMDKHRKKRWAQGKLSRKS